MSSSPGGTLPAIRRESNCGADNPLVSQTTCFAGPPTLRRAMTLMIFIACERGHPAQMMSLCAISVSSVSRWLRTQRNTHHRGTANTEVAQRRSENMNALGLADPSDVGANLVGTRQCQLVGTRFRYQF